MINLIAAEKYLERKIIPELNKTGLAFHGPHTLAVVKKLKEILENNPGLKVDEAVLIIASYAHDWGYAGLLDETKSITLQQVGDIKIAHAEIGAEKVNNLLGDKFFDSLANSQKERIIHLVKVHDLLNELKETDELLLMEADTLGALDVSLVKPSFDFESNERWINGVRTKRISRFITKYSRNEAELLIKSREEYYKNHQIK